MRILMILFVALTFVPMTILTAIGFVLGLQEAGFMLFLTWGYLAALFMGMLGE